MKRMVFIVLLIMIMAILSCSKKVSPKNEVKQFDIMQKLKTCDYFIGFSIEEGKVFLASIKDDFYKDLTLAINNKKYDLSNMELEIGPINLNNEDAVKDTMLYCTSDVDKTIDFWVTENESCIVEVYKNQKSIYRHVFKTPGIPIFNDSLKFDDKGNITVGWTYNGRADEYQLSVFNSYKSIDNTEKNDKVCSRLIDTKSRSYTLSSKEKEIIKQGKSTLYFALQVINYNEKNGVVLYSGNDANHEYVIEINK